jgi:hypothetical protein
MERDLSVPYLHRYDSTDDETFEDCSSSPTLLKRFDDSDNEDIVYLGTFVQVMNIQYK